MLSNAAALTFLPFAVAVGIWVSWSDMRFMKIPNKAVLALLAVWLVVGLLVVPFHTWAWGWALAAIVLAAGFIGNAAGLLGAGDAKFATAMAPFFALSDPRLVLILLAACLLGAFASHRLLRLVPQFRAAAPDWQSWTHADFPMGLALSGMLIFYLALEWWY